VTRLGDASPRDEPSPFHVFLVAESADPVITTGGMKVIPDYVLEDCPRLDILVIPGGWGTRREMTNERLLEWVRGRAGDVETLASVCTGSLVLGAAGLLEGKRATTHWAALDLMAEKLPGTLVDREQHVVEQGSLFTSAGISAGIDMALKVVARHCGESVARRTARYMEYPYPDSNRRRVDVSRT
jgi:transcriptional regulator GlxA family with amidase domain